MINNEIKNLLNRRQSVERQLENCSYKNDILLDELDSINRQITNEAIKESDKFCGMT